MNEEVKNVEVVAESNTEKSENKARTDRRNNNNRRPRRNNNNAKPKTDLEEKVIDIKRVTKVVKGGRQFRFSATVVVGNRKGKVGLGIGKAKEMPDAVKKATQAANRNLINVGQKLRVK